MQRHAPFLIASTYIGTVVGAGFASGQEVLQFFTAFGPWGLAGLAVCLVLFAAFGMRVLDLGRVYDADSHRPLLVHVGGRRFGGVLDGLLMLFLLATVAAMASGAGATGVEQYGWPRGWGSALLIGLAVVTVLAGIEGVVRSMGFISPVLVVIVLLISAYSLAAGGGLKAAHAWRGDMALTMLPTWYAAAPLYVAYNMLLSIPVLAYLGASVPDPGAARLGALFGGVGLVVGALAIHLAVAVNLPEAAGVDIPILSAAKALPPWVSGAYSVLLIAEIYTTAVATLFGFAARIAAPGGWGFRLAVLAGGAAGLVGGQWKFAELIGTLYPVMGAVGIIILVGLWRSPRRFH